MSKDLLKKIAGGSVLAIVVTVGGYFLWQQLKFESQLDDLKQFCNGLSNQASIDEIQMTTTLSPTLRLILLTADADGNQVGSIYIAGASRGSCDITLSRGRLINKSFSFGYKDPNNPGQKLKPW